MKKIIISAVIVIVVIILGFSIYKEFFSNNSVSGISNYDIKKIENVRIETTSTDIEVVRGSSSEIIVEIDGEQSKREANKFRLNVTEKGDRLEITYKRVKEFFSFGFAFNQDVTLRVTLPEKTFNEVVVDSVSGDVEMDAVSAKRVDAKTVSGDLELQQIQSTNLMSIKSTSGDIDVDQADLNEFKIGSISGTVEVHSLIAVNGEIKTTSGDINVDLEKEMESLAIDSTSGDIDVNLEKEIESLILDTTSGDVQTTFRQKPTSLNIRFNSTSGRAMIDLPEVDYEVNDKNKVIGKIGNGSNTLKIETTSGDIKVK